MKTPRAALALAVAVSFFAQSTGAADLAFVAARPMLAAQLPPRALLAPRPARAEPRTSVPGMDLTGLLRRYASDLRMVIDWLLAPEESAAAVPARTPRDVAAKPSPAAPAEPPSVVTSLSAPDRILIVPDPLIVGASQVLSEALAVPTRQRTLPRVEGRWIEARGFRFRVVYLDSYGETIGREGGFELRRGGRAVFLPARVPAALRAPAPIYYRGRTARFRIEVEAREALRGLWLSFREEEIDGAVITPFRALGTLTLAKGKKAFVEGTTPLLGRKGDGPISFERTHVVARIDGETSARADASDAGLIDPPND